MKLEFSQQIFKQYRNIKINANPSSESKAVLCGQTDKWMNRQTGGQRHDKADSCFSNFTNTPKRSNFYTKKEFI
jgi:hypothetical protein